jgi:hypothetical protein
MPRNFTKVIGLAVLTGLSVFIQAQSDFSWSQAGPVYNSGRSRNLVVDKRDPSGNTLFTGSASSGVFKTINGGALWSPLNDQGRVRNISYMAQGSDNTIYVATGEGFLRAGQALKAQVGTGLYILQGDTLALREPASNVGTIINRIACRTNANVVALATNKGIFVSKDGGAFFNTGIPTTSLTSGQDVKFDQSGTLYCSIGNEKSFTGSPSSQIYKSNDNSSYTSFAPITPTSSALGTPKYGRIELAIAPSNDNVIYASIARKATNPVDNSASLNGLFVSYDAGQNWGLILQGGGPLDPMTDEGPTASGDYAQAILVNPTNSDQLIFGSYKLYLFQRTGGSNSSPTGIWNRISQSFSSFFSPSYLHENIHDIKIIGSGASAKFYFVTDAGIFRSVDLAAAISNGSTFPSYQPFYKGLVTGQFNSVSIQAFPSGTVATTGTITANNAFIGGTGGNGLTYFDGIFPLASQETNYSSAEIYNAEFSKILPNAAYFTSGTANGLFRITDVRSAQPDRIFVNTYSGSISRLTPAGVAFANEATNPAGNPFKLWENYGQVQNPPDTLVFYNDSLRVSTGISGGIPTLTTQTTFTFSSGRPNKFALIDSIAIRTGTVLAETPSSPVPPQFSGNDRKDIFIKLANNYTVSSGITNPPVSLRVGPAAAASVTLDAGSGLDNIAVTFTSPPFLSKTTPSFTGVPDASVYYKVFATIFYKYKVGDSITIKDNSISTKNLTYSFALTKPLRWSLASPNAPKPIPAPTNQVQKVAARISARIALVYQSSKITGGVPPAVLVSKAPLSLNEPLNLVRVSQSGCLTTDANGAPTNTTIKIIGKPILLEWSKRGTELFYATDSNRLYRVSNIGMILDNSPSSYSGKLNTDIFTFSDPPNTTTVNPRSPYRTTLLGTFTKPITSISIDKNDSAILLTFNDPSGMNVSYSKNNILKSDFSNINFSSKTSPVLANLTTYCSLIIKDTAKVAQQVLIGTDNGLFYTNNIRAQTPTWTQAIDKQLAKGNQLPNVQIFDIKQQTLEPWNCYNSGQIYVATNGRGIWTNKKYYTGFEFVTGLDELPGNATTENNLVIYPNPTNGNVNVSFNSIDGETAAVSVMDINGRVVKMENLGKLISGQGSYSFETNDLSAGMYIVNVSSSSGIKRVAKLIVSK